jgi:hypothetical protein
MSHTSGHTKGVAAGCGVSVFGRHLTCARPLYHWLHVVLRLQRIRGAHGCYAGTLGAAHVCNAQRSTLLELLHDVELPGCQRVWLPACMVL